ncbi:MAG: hypothetical protein IJF69_05940 [Clostridia bacterium]|nr:hypothetical protein [Clostridia bacterium]
MKIKVLSIIFAAILIFCMPLCVIAGEEPDVNRKGSISVSMTYEGKAVGGGELTLYRVAQVHEENGADYSFVYTADYAGCSVKEETLTASDVAGELCSYTQKNGIDGITLEPGKDGKATAENLELGLYLVVQTKAAEGFTKVEPFVVTVPQFDGESYMYSVDATPKIDKMPETVVTTAPPEETTPPDKLPQTGLNNVPVPVLAVIGLAFVTFGIYLITSDKKRDHE